MALSFSASAAAADESTSGEESDHDSSSTERSSRKKRGKRNSKSGKTAKIATRVVRRQLWPHSELSMGYVSKNVSYDELTLEEFVAAYSAILLLPQVSSHERRHRTEHLGALMYLASIYEWRFYQKSREVALTGRIHFFTWKIVRSQVYTRRPRNKSAPPPRLQMQFCFAAITRRVCAPTPRITTPCLKGNRNGFAIFVRHVG